MNKYKALSVLLLINSITISFFIYPKEKNIIHINTNISNIQSNLNISNKETSFYTSKIKNNNNLIKEKIAINPNYIYTNEIKELYANNIIQIKLNPEPTSEIIENINKREKINILGYNDFNNTYKINYKNNIYYIDNKNLINDINLILDELNDEKYIKINTNLIDYPSETSNTLIPLKINDKIKVIGNNNKGYLKIKYNEFEGFIKEEYINNTPIIQNESINTTQGENVPAKFTAYYPANNSMEGGYFDAIGNLLDYTQNTCAAPKNIPLGTKIQIKDTNTSLDGQIFTVTDRGGAINIEDGVYHFDILMDSSETCNSWGIKYGNAIIIQ